MKKGLLALAITAFVVVVGCKREEEAPQAKEAATESSKGMGDYSKMMPKGSGGGGMPMPSAPTQPPPSTDAAKPAEK